MQIKLSDYDNDCCSVMARNTDAVNVLSLLGYDQFLPCETLPSSTLYAMLQQFCVTVCLSDCLSHSWFLGKRINGFSWFSEQRLPCLYRMLQCVISLFGSVFCWVVDSDWDQRSAEKVKLFFIWTQRFTVCDCQDQTSDWAIAISKAN